MAVGVGGAVVGDLRAIGAFCTLGPAANRRVGWLAAGAVALPPETDRGKSERPSICGKPPSGNRCRDCTEPARGGATGVTSSAGVGSTSSSCDQSRRSCLIRSASDVGDCPKAGATIATLIKKALVQANVRRIMITSLSFLQKAIGGKAAAIGFLQRQILSSRKRASPAEDLCCRPVIGSTGCGDLTDPRKITG